MQDTGFCTYKLTWFEVKDHVEGLAVVRNLLIEPRQVEFVLDIVLINLRKTSERVSI